jgi:hypothetical protein
MKRLLQLITVGVLFLFVSLSISNAQVYSAGPSVSPPSGAANGGFAWADLNKDGILDVWIPSNNILLNSISTFAVSTTMAANITLNTNSVGGALADFNGDGVPDLMTTNGGTPSAGLYYNTAGVLTLATGTGDLATAPTFGVGNGQVFMGLGVGPIDHSNNLSIVYTPCKTSYADALVFKPGYGIVLLKGGASGFTNAGNNATVANLAIDTSKSFESWDPRFLDANNDGWMDLMMPSFRHGFQRTYGGPDSAGARKGCIQFLNDGTGKFIIPTATTLGRTIYNVDSIVTGICYGRAVGDTGIIVDDTVRHFGAIGNQFGDLNNDGNQDLILTYNSADNYDGVGGFKNTVVLYGKGDGTYTYKWDGITIVANGLNNAGNTRAWGLGDYNNDGKQDLYISATFGSQFLFKNNGNGTFSDVTTEAVVTGGGQRAGGFVDFNNDGFLDIYQYTGGTSVLQKNNGNTNKWVGFTPIGTGNNTMAIGARFTVWSGTTRQIRDIRASGGAAGLGGEVRALFGLGTGTLDSVMVQWPDGTTNKWTGTQLSANGGTTLTNKYWTIKQGAIIPVAVVKVGPSWAAGDTSLTPYDTLKWNSTGGGTGTVTYQAQVATASTFASVLKDVTGLTATSTIVRLGLSTKYYWRVRAISAGFTGVWSAVDSFRTKYIQCTTIPTKRYPASNQNDLPAKPTLKVSYVAEASTYHIQLAGSDTAFVKNGAFVLNDSVNVLDTAVTTVSLTPGKKYFWRVRGWNPAGNSSWSTVDSFTIMYLPATPVLSYPTSNMPNARPDTLIMKWRKVAGDSNYVVQTWMYNSAGTVLRSDTTKKDTTLKLTSLMSRTRYYWKVMSFNQGGASAFTAIDSFTTSIEAPPAPVLRSPKNIDNVNRKALFIWSSAVTAESYHLQVATVNFPTTNIVIDKMLIDTSILISDTLAASTTYYWRVSGKNAGGEGVFSASTFFTTGTKVSVGREGNEIPTVFALMQNYPNPFNPTTTIRYDVPTTAFVNVTIYDVLGRQVATLVNEVQSPSAYMVQWNASSLSSGMYILRIRARSNDGQINFTSVKKLLFTK